MRPTSTLLILASALLLLAACGNTPGTCIAQASEGMACTVNLERRYCSERRESKFTEQTAAQGAAFCRGEGYTRPIFARNKDGQDVNIEPFRDKDVIGDILKEGGSVMFALPKK